MWFCTDHGVVRYDGFRMEVFDKSKSLPYDVIFKIYEDVSGCIWFYGYNGTLSWYSHKENKIVPYKYNHLLSKLNHGDFITLKDFAVDKNGTVCYGGLYRGATIDANGKLSYLKNKGFRNYTEFNDQWIFTGTFDRKYLAKNVIRIVFRSKKERYFRSSDYFPPSDDRPIYSFEMEKIGRQNMLVINDWLVDLDDKNNKTHVEGFTGMYCIDGDLWVSTLFGAYLYKKKNGKIDLRKFDGCYLKNQQITAVTKDREGGFWFSTLDDGIYYAANPEIVNWYPGSAKNQNTIYAINGFNNEVYYATAFGYYDLRSGTQILEKKRGLHTIGIWRNQVVLASHLTINRKERCVKRSWGFELDEFSDWTVDKYNNFYGIYVTLYKIDPKEEKLKISIDINSIYDPNKQNPHLYHSLVIDDKDRIYAGSSLGLFEVVNGKYKRVRLPALNQTKITGLAHHKNWGTIVATRGKGLIFLKDGKIVRRIEQKDGLLTNQLNTLYLDKDGTIYVGTNKGVSKIVRSSKGWIGIYNLTRLTGLLSSEINCIYSNSQGVYIGSRNGITLVPASYSWDNRPLEKQLQIQAVYANGKLLKTFKDFTEFNSSQKVIRFLLKTSNYKSQHQRPYLYRFRKSDPWSVGVSGELILINPAFETYELEVKYENELGAMGQPYTLAKFSMLPPFYSTWWFTGILFVIGLLSVFLFFRRRLKVIQNRNKIQRNMELLEQKALLAQMNPHFIFNSLNSIQSFLLYNENELAERYLLKLSKLIRLTLTNSRETEISIEKEIESLKMYLELEQMRFKNRFDFEFKITISNEDMLQLVPPMLIQPFVENSIIHGFKKLKEGGLIHISFLKIANGTLFVEVSDNGIGYENTLEKIDEEHKSYGTKITMERLSIFKQKYQEEFSYSIESLSDADGNATGTRVKMTIPVI